MQPPSCITPQPSAPLQTEPPAAQVPELNVQNGVLKALSFLFEYIGEMGKDYIYAVTPLLEDALMDRDLVHRQTAASVVQHMSMGVAGLGCEDALLHLLNYVWPNIFETSPHVVNAVTGAIEGCRLALGPAIVLNYVLQVCCLQSPLCCSGLALGTALRLRRSGTGPLLHAELHRQACCLGLRL